MLGFEVQAKILDSKFRVGIIVETVLAIINKGKEKLIVRRKVK